MQVLGVAVDASDFELRQAKRQLSLQTHPDKCTTPGAREAFELVTTAAECLLDPGSRRTYDAGRSAARSRSAGTARAAEEEPCCSADPRAGFYVIHRCVTSIRMHHNTQPYECCSAIVTQSNIWGGLLWQICVCSNNVCFTYALRLQGKKALGIASRRRADQPLVYILRQAAQGRCKRGLGCAQRAVGASLLRVPSRRMERRALPPCL